MTITLALTTFLILVSASFAKAVDAPIAMDTECSEFINSIEARYKYGWIQVAETPTSSDRISIFYFYKKTASLKNPVIFFNGGPGFTSHGMASSLEISKTKYSGGKNIDIDFIFMDQRGTGCSSRFPVGASPQTIEKLNWYGSAGIVNDAEELRKNLIGSRKWKVFGQSFGGHVVHRYIQMFPKSIVKAYAHGYSEGIADFDFSFARIASQHTIMQSYLKKFPEDRQRLLLLNQYLADASKCFITKDGQGNEVCGYEISSMLISYLGFRNNWEILRADLRHMVPDGEVSTDKVRRFVGNAAATFSIYHGLTPFNEEFFMTKDLALNILGVSDTDRSPMDYDKCIAVYERIQTVYNVKAADILLDECKAPVQFGYRDSIMPVLKAKNVQLVNSISILEIKAKLAETKIPFFLYSGSFDCMVPKELFQNEVKVLGKLVTYTNFPDSGHEGFMSEARVIHDLAN